MQDAAMKEVAGMVSPIFGLYQHSWFVNLWTETAVQGIHLHYKEELALALFEASLKSLATEFAHSSDSIIKRAWVNVCLETAEICSKVLDWHSNS